jgi:hypothetical protein
MSGIINNLKKASEKVKVKVITTDADVRKTRLDICHNCEHLIKITQQCGKCGCFVQAKTWLTNASCPISKW